MTLEGQSASGEISESAAGPARPEPRPPSVAGIPPVRGIVLAHTAKGRPVPQVDLERWIRLNRLVFKCEKVDVLFHGCDLSLFRRLGGCARELEVRLGVRTDCAGPSPAARALREAEPWDVFLCPRRVNGGYFDEWLAACSEAGVRARVQVQGPFERDWDAATFAQRLAEAGVVTANVAVHDPFAETQPTRNALHTESTVDRMVALAAALDARGVEAHLLWLPFCAVKDEARRFLENSRQFFADHAHYQRDSYELARKLYRRHPLVVRQAMLMHLGLHTSSNSPIDRILLPWIMEHPWARARVWAAHKLTRHLRIRAPRLPEPKSPAEAELAAEQYRAVREKADAAHAHCRFRRICDGLTKEVKRALPGLAVLPEPGELVLDPFYFSKDRWRYYDPLDEARRELDADTARLADAANALVANTPPTREIDSFAYKVDGTWSWQLPGSLRWFSYSPGEKLSTPLGRLDLPFTLSVTFGGGIADYIGFSLGRACRLLVPMTAYSHRVVLHADGAGRYVLLRDGVPMRPIEFTGAFYAPIRLGTGLEPRISIWNIDGTIGTQAVHLWEGSPSPQSAGPTKYSIVIVCTRYARRLQANLTHLAHLRGVEPSDYEVIVAFVPGLDATSDVIESVKLAHPHLRIVSATFARENANTKGLLLNEALDRARGEWVIILDADTLIAPDMLEKLGELPADCRFAVPDGRKMLAPETTARVLLGELRPWEEWHALLNGAGEYRMREADGVPVGYCQCVRRECLQQVRYEEMHHFEGADWKFGKDMRDRYGLEHRLSGSPVLHLDHGSSNWYGATRHF